MSKKKNHQSEIFDIQRKIVANMTSESWEQIPHVSYVYEADVTDLLKVYRQVKESAKTNITINTVLIKLIVESLKAAPKLNSHLDFKRRLVQGELKTFDSINVSMPMLLPDGRMMTVNLMDFQNKSLIAMAEYISEVSRRMKNTDLNEVMYEVSLSDTMDGLKDGNIKQAFYRLVGSKFGKHKVKTKQGSERRKYYSIPEKDRLTKEDIEQGTVTISNLGSLYREQKGFGTLIEIVPPQVCAFALGAVQDKPVVVTDQHGNKSVQIRRILPITIVFDHRALDFGDVVPFIRQMDNYLTNPEVLQEWRGQDIVRKIETKEGE